MASRITTGTALLALTTLLFACENKPILEGERHSPREDLGIESPASDRAAAMATGSKPVAVSLPGQRNIDWTHPAGNSQHAPGNAAYSGALSPYWTANAGAAQKHTARTVADPIIVGGRIFTLDSADTVTATGTNGATLWQASLVPADGRPDASGGGLAYGEGLLFATTGFGEIVAINPANGGIVWRQDTNSAIGAAPAIAGGKVFAQARNGSIWAVGARDGKVAWERSGAPSNGGITGASAPAISGDLVLFPSANSEIHALKIADGAPVWANAAAGERPGRAHAQFSDVTGGPVVAGGRVYVATAAGVAYAIDAATGRTIWQVTEGATSPIVVAGNALFMVNDEDQLVRLEPGSGAVVWRTDLPFYVKDRVRKRKAIYGYYGPVLAGGRLIVASSGGVLQSFDPATGRLVGQADLPGGAASAPAVSGGTLYVLSRKGQLLAFR